MAKSRRPVKKTEKDDQIPVETVEEEAVQPSEEETPEEPIIEEATEEAEAVEPPEFVEDEADEAPEEATTAPTPTNEETEDGRNSAAAEEPVEEKEICDSLNKEIMMKLSNQKPNYPRSAPDAAKATAAGYVPIRMLKTLNTPPMMKSKSFRFRWASEFPHCKEGEIYLVPPNMAGVLVENGSAFGG